MKSKFAILLSYCCFSALIYAQEKKDTLVTGNFENVLLVDLFRSLEARSPYFFYYNESQLDSARVNVVAQNDPIQAVLEKALQNTGLSFSIDNYKRVYITKGLKFTTKLPTGFFPSPTETRPPTVTKDSVIDYGLGTSRKEKVTSETRLYEIGVKTNAAKGDAIITGIIRSSKTGEPIINASVFIDNNHSTVTDAYGYYSLNVPAGKYTLNILAIGMRDTKLQIAVYSDGKLDIDIKDQITTLKEVVVSSKKLVNVNRVQMGVERLSIDNIRRVPSVFGEADVLRVITSLPGVKTVGEASTGFNVRGGSADQNLILYNDATIYNPSHFFGMFSAFNPDVIKDLELYKSSMPVKYGGRLASVL